MPKYGNATSRGNLDSSQKLATDASNKLATLNLERRRKPSKRKSPFRRKSQAVDSNESIE